MAEFFAGKTVVVTGAAGFVASHLVDRLLEMNATVIGVDNFITGREENIAHLFEGGMSALQDLRDSETPAPSTNRSNYAFITADVTQDPRQYLPSDLSIDVIFHLASPASPPRYQAHPVETYLVNSLGTHQLLSYLQLSNPQARFIFSSTSEVYGDPQVHPQTESYWGNVNPNGKRSCYDESKRMGEAICGVFNRDFGMNVRIARIFNTYGPRMDPTDGRIIPNFISQALAHQPLTIYGSGTQTRSYCYVDDLVDGLLLLASVETANGETINLGNPDEYTIDKTAEIVQNITGGSREVVSRELPADDPQRRKPDISKAQHMLNWQPKVKFEDGLAKTVEYFRQTA